MKQIELYASGWMISRQNGKAGVGIVVVTNQLVTQEISVVIDKATTNSVFLAALIIGLQVLEIESEVTIYTHSQIIAKCASGEYGRHSNLDMWKDFDYESECHDVKVVWIRKDSHEHNTLSSKLAKQAVSYYE